MLDYINTNTFRDLGNFIIWNRNYNPFTSNILKQNSIIWLVESSGTTVYSVGASYDNSQFNVNVTTDLEIGYAIHLLKD